jgi:hypothetical protein
MVKKKKSKSLVRSFIYGGLVLVAVVGFYVVHKYGYKQVPLSQTGILTAKFSSCGQINLKDGKAVHAQYICDGGQSLKVDGGIEIFVGNGNSLIKEKPYHAGDFDKAKVGDTIEVLYELDEHGYAKATCNACGVKIIKQANLPEQTLN